MGDRYFFFAGGGTGGHIYPAVAVAKRLAELDPTATIRFFCSSRSIDEQILGKTGFEFTVLPARGLTRKPKEIINFFRCFVRSYKTARRAISGLDHVVVIGVGGFVSAPVCLAAYRCNVPIALLNVDIVPGRANRLIARWAGEIFVQFKDTKEYFAGKKGHVNIVGCPLRSGFANPRAARAIEQLGLDASKKVLLITGASSGSENINNAVCSLLEKLDAFADDWQIVHLAGMNNFDEVAYAYGRAKIRHKVLDYFDDMPDLLAAADLVIGRSGAVSVAEYAAAAVPSICMPYPYHKDRHQYLNAGKLVEVGAAVIVDDVRDEKDRAEWLWEELEKLMKDEKARQVMAEGCRMIANSGADLSIAETLMTMADA